MNRGGPQDTAELWRRPYRAEADSAAKDVRRIHFVGAIP